MNISIRFWFFFGIIVTSCFLSVHCAANVNILIADDEDTSNIPQLNGNLTEETTSSLKATAKVRDRNIFARCFASIWDWVQQKAVGVMEDQIISGNPDNVRFYLYPNPDKKDEVEEILYNDVTSLSKAHFRANQPWKIIIHGFTNHHISEPVQQIKNGYLMRMQRMRSSPSGGLHYAPNVIVVDWGMLADPKFSGDAGNAFYGFAVKNVPIVGKRVGEFLLFLLKNRALFTFDNVHLIGFSLGSHVSANAGNTLRQLTGQIPARISGLDPAGPSFYQGLAISSRRLSTEDAQFVDIIHTNQGALGIYKNIGHVDFYPNGGGPFQKPCITQYGQSHNENAVVMLNTCSHSKAPFFFSLSINNQIVGCRCNSILEWKTTCPCTDKAVFGEFCDTQTRGTFYLDLDH